MRFFTEERAKYALTIFIFGGIGIFLLYLAFRYFFPVALPFLIAFSVAALLQKPTKAVSKLTRIPRRIISPLLSVIFVSALLGGIGFLVWKCISEIGEFARAVITGENALLENLQNFLSEIGALIARLPFSGGENAENLRNRVTETVLDMAKNTAIELGTKLPELAGRLASAVPQALIFCVVTILSAVYFCADYDKITSFIQNRLRGKARVVAEKIRLTTGTTLLKVLRSYAILFLLTFAELFLGFSILGERYAFLLAFLTALVDSLPILGTGTILLPIALYRFFMGDTRTAIGFAILYLAVTVIRQILEPKILGAGVGMHPMLMLVSMYTGLKLFGVLGMLLLPILAMVLKNTITAFRKSVKEAPRASS